MIPQLLTYEQLIKKGINLSKSLLITLESRGLFPKRVRLSKHTFAWVAYEIDDWIRLEWAIGRKNVRYPADRVEPTTIDDCVCVECGTAFKKENRRGVTFRKTCSDLCRISYSKKASRRYYDNNRDRILQKELQQKILSQAMKLLLNERGLTIEQFLTTHGAEHASQPVS